MRKIKFRGRNVENGQYVYAELGEITAELNPNYLTFITNAGVFEVENNSVAQLVGVDKDGVEIYEGDAFRMKYADEETERHYEAQFIPAAIEESGCIFHEPHFKKYSIRDVNKVD